MRSFTKENRVISSLQVLFNNRSERFASYRCFANNSEGTAADRIDIRIVGEHFSTNDHFAAAVIALLFVKIHLSFIVSRAFRGGMKHRSSSIKS